MNNNKFLSLQELELAYTKTPLGRAENLVNKKIGRLTFLYRVKHSGYSAYWACRCECGVYVIVRAAHVLQGRIYSCGCLASEKRKAQKVALVPRIIPI